MELEKSERKSLRRSGFLAVLCGSLPAIIIVVIWGGFISQMNARPCMDFYGFYMLMYIPLCKLGLEFSCSYLFSGG